MTISDQNRSFFEAIGLSEIRRELVVGSINYLGTGTDPRRTAAREWVSEQDAKAERAIEEARQLERSRFRQILGWTIAGVSVAAVAALAAVIAAWPVIRQWLG